MNPEKTFFNILRMCVYEIFFLLYFVNEMMFLQYLQNNTFFQIVIFDMPNALPKRA